MKTLIIIGIVVALVIVVSVVLNWDKDSSDAGVMDKNEQEAGR